MFSRPVHRKVLARPSGASKTEVHWKDYQDINNIIARVMRGDSSAIRRGAVHADVSEMPDTLQDALNQQKEAAYAYDALPDAVKAKYPTAEAFYAACQDPSQKEELAKLGLLNVPEDEKPVKVEIANPVTPDGATAS